VDTRTNMDWAQISFYRMKTSSVMIVIVI